jgi:hypothetical protein
MAADACGILDHRSGAGPDRFQRADGHHQRGFLPLKERVRLDGQACGVGEPEVLVETTGERRREMRVTVDEAGNESLSASVIDLGVRIRLQNRIAGTDRDDLVPFDGERHIVLNGIDVHDGCMRENDRSDRRGLRAHATLFEEEASGASAGRDK